MDKPYSDSLCPFRLTELWHEDKESGTVVVFSDLNLSLSSQQLNEIGSFIWKLLDGKHSVRDIALSILSECEGEKPEYQSVRDDVIAFVGQLRDKGLVQWDDGDSVDVLLVMPPFPSVYASKSIKTPEYSAPPLGLCYLASVLRLNGFTVSILDMHQNAKLPEDIISECRKLRPKILGITSTTPTYPNAELIARLAKAFNSNVVTVIGGAHATCLPDECLKSGAFDYVCVGEGEYTLLELTEALVRKTGDALTIPGLVTLDSNGDIQSNGVRERVSDLDSIPWPARDLLDLDSYYQKGSIISSRGCPFNCNYCACAVISGRTYRTHSVNYVLNEIQAVSAKYGYKYFDFHDDCFNLDSQRVFELCSEIKNRKMEIEWGCFCRAAQFTPTMAKAMAGAGCKVIQFGVESGNQTVLTKIKKSTTLKQIEDAVIAANEAKIKQIVCGFIIGHPQDTEDTVTDTINFGLRLSELGATRLTLSLLTPYPGTEVFLNMKQYGITLLEEDWEKYTFSRVVMETRNLPKERLRELYSIGIGLFLKATQK
ncbi:MAG: cobalamin-dependent protein [Nitrospirae bacterium]|nr:cobalamin-dependent protein [Nitrospirota bacterium]